MNDNRPIGVFDSGVGGLTFAKEIKRLLPHESMIYFGDTQHLPYGEKSKEAITRFSVDITNFLKENNCKAILVACNSATSNSIEAIKKAAGDEAMSGMGTTVVVVTVIGEKAWVANVGDSRMYVVGKEIKQVTRDHSLVEEMVRMGEIAKDAAKDHPDKNIITRAVGAADKVVADFFQVNLEPQDYILICTDGLTNMVEDQDIRSIINSQRDVAECAERLVRTANDNGGKDNITVVVIEPF